MKTTAQLFEGYTVPTVKSRRSERGDLISFFLEKVNGDRRRDGYKEYKMSQLSYFLSIFTTEQLYHLRRKCEESKSFGKTFNYYCFKKA